MYSGKGVGMKKAVIVLLVLMVCCAKENTPKDGAIRVNGSWIKKDQIDRISDMYRQEMLRAYPEKALQALPPDLKKNIARQLIANEVVLQEAKKRKMGYSADKYQTTLEGIKKQFRDSSMLAAELAKMGQTESDMKGQIRDGLTVDSLIKTLSKPGDSVTVKACKVYYDSNQSRFASEKKYRASHILFLVKKQTTPDQKKAIEQNAQKVLMEVKSGKDFAALAKKYSQDPNVKTSGGDIGWFKQGDLPEIESAVKTLQMNQVSGVVESHLGYHIIKKTGEETLPPQTFDKVQGQIKNMLQLKKQNDVVKHFVDSLMAVANIFYADTSLKAPFGGGMQ
jgi:parvulin-like peptidyl-prolyl isomerase